MRLPVRMGQIILLWKKKKSNTWTEDPVSSNVVSVWEGQSILRGVKQIPPPKHWFSYLYLKNIFNA